MAKNKYTAEQSIMNLREVDHLCKQGKTVAEALACIEITEELYYRWRQKYGWMVEDEYQRMKELESENERLKEIVRRWVAVMGEQVAPLRVNEGANKGRSYY